MGFANLFQRKVGGIENGFQVSLFANLCRVGQDLSMLLTLDVVQHGNQHEHNMQGQTFEMGLSQVEFTERDGRGNLTIQRGSLEGLEHVGSSDRVVDHVKTLAIGVLCDVGFDGFFFVVDGSCAHGFNELGLFFSSATGSVDLGPKGFGQLEGDMAHTASTTMDKNGLVFGSTWLDSRSDQSFVCGDTDQRKSRSLLHAKILRFQGDELGIGGNVLGQGTGQICQSSGTAIDFISDFKILDPITDCLDGSGKVHPQQGGFFGR
mmetsp:Transcript_10194/g.24511  ORF Transcript_10194/g.24511 Transcript_10194/m.24511 type:complete len:263 (-) Transcript_10194:333-1121(-)